MTKNEKPISAEEIKKALEISIAGTEMANEARKKALLKLLIKNG